MSIAFADACHWLEFSGREARKTAASVVDTKLPRGLIHRQHVPHGRIGLDQVRRREGEAAAGHHDVEYGFDLFADLLHCAKCQRALR